MKKNKDKNKNKPTGDYYDYSLLTIVIFLACYGLVMMYSASSVDALISHKNPMYFFDKQAKIYLFSIVIMFIIAKINYHWYAKPSFLFYIGAFILMALVLTPLGEEHYGARRWLKMPLGFQMQPSEVMKIAIILYLPYLCCRAGAKVRDWKVMSKITAWGVAAALGVFVLTDNLSTGLIVFGMVMVMWVVVYPNSMKWYWTMIVSGIAGYIGIRVFGEYILGGVSENFRMNRVLVWLNPEKYSSQGGLQVLQGLYAVGSGGLFGKGFGSSVQKKIIPEVQNDMIFAVICEELGVIGVILLLLLFGMLLYRLMYIAQNAPDLYGSLIVTGIFAHIALQVVLNICVVLNLIPTTGITLPFVSYGGTSIVFLMIEMGIALGVSNRIKFEE